MRIPLVALGFSVCIGLGLIGCSEEERIQLPEATLEGTVSYQGKAVPYAMVLVTGEGQSAQGFADENGKFRIEHAPSGSVQIGVNTDAGRGNMMSAVMGSKLGDKKSPAPVFVDVPKQFFDPATSGIKTTVSDPKGVTTFDIKVE